MKWMIASDMHGSAFYCEKMLKAFEREQADKLLLLGDILYHGPRNNLPKGYAPKKVIELLNNIRKDSLCSWKLRCGSGPDGIRIPDYGRVCDDYRGRFEYLCDTWSSF